MSQSKFIRLGNVIVAADQILFIKFDGKESHCGLKMPGAGENHALISTNVYFDLPENQSAEDFLSAVSETIAVSSITASISK